MNKTSAVLLTALALVIGVIAGHIFWTTTVVQQVGGSVAGTTNSTARIASCVLDMSTTTMTTATTTATGCLFNGDENDRIVTSVELSFNGLGAINSNNLATSTMTMSTSSAQWATSSPNVLLNLGIGTTTALAPAGNAYIASSSPGVTGSLTIGGQGGSLNDFARRWKASSYLNLTQTGSSTAQGVVVVKYFIAN